MKPTDLEALGELYLGRVLDPRTRAATGEPMLLASRELTTHGVIVGMTGSGKTGLGVTLLEELALDGVPAIVIDPKGDLANLALTFPELSAEAFAPWVDGEDPARVAETWRQGLAEWGQDGARIARLRAAADVVVYTPGARIATQLSLLGGFQAPPPELRDAADLVRERAVAAASALCGLIGVEADPVRSRELLLISTLLERAWAEGRDLALPDVVRGVHEPPFERVGLFDLESFFPAKARFELALALNQLLASPGFAAWTEGPPLSVPALLRGASGRPRLSVLSIAHLSDAQRMFFVTALLAEVVTWMRAQPGSQTLRALLYMDEIYGYFPPSASPPSKPPMLTLLKQARAFGLGVVLATQNPVDLDYKGLGNAGTWMIGRLQTERDKARVLDGLEGAAAVAGQALERAELEALLGSLPPRTFVVRSAGQDAPQLMQTRWALSYLRGPLTREQLGRLAGPERQAQAPAAATSDAPISVDVLAGAGVDETIPATPALGESGERPVLPGEISQFFEPPAHEGPVHYRPTLFGSARVRFSSAKIGLEALRTVALAARLDGAGADGSVAAGAAAGVDWAHAEALPAGATLDRRPVDAPARWAPLPAAAARAKSYAAWRRGFEAYLAQTMTMTLWRCAQVKATSNPGESEAEFRARLAESARAARAVEADKLRRRYAPKVAAAEKRVLAAQDRVSREASQASAQTVDTAVSVGSSILGALFGRRATVSGHVGRARSAARSASRAAKERADVVRAEEALRQAHEAFAALEQEITEAVRKLDQRFDPAALVLEPLHVKPKKSDISVGVVALLWRSESRVVG